MAPDKAAKRPQESKTKNADTRSWSYEPGRYRKLDEHIDQYAAAGGPIWETHLLGRDQLSFGEFLQRPELAKLFPIGSDARAALDELRQQGNFHGAPVEAKRALTAFIYDSKLYATCEYRRVQHAFNTIWGLYEGYLKSHGENRKLALDVDKAARRREARRKKDAARKAAARSRDPLVVEKSQRTRRERLETQIESLRSQAEKKGRRANELLRAQAELTAKADRKEAELMKLVATPAEPAR